jgi:predicted nucleic acid-binding protein
VTVCPNTSPLIVLARLDRLDLLGTPTEIVITGRVLAEVRDKADVVTSRVEVLMTSGSHVVDVIPSDRVDVTRNLGPGETSVLSFALASPSATSCVLDDAAARAEARRLGLSVTGTLGLILRAKVEGRIETAAPLLRAAVEAGLYIDEATVARALTAVGEK